jgi:cellobiose phosphorylase
MYQFIDENKEINFLQYNTPTPWMNYLSNGTFHTMISQAGGGVAFYKSPQIWRINHYKFFHIPTDRSGFYTYIKDGTDFWCPTNEPAKSKPEKWSSTHGLGYTVFNAERNGIKADVKYFVGKFENALIWNLKITSKENKKITIFPFVELGMMEFMRELQWQCYNKHQLNVSFDSEEEILIYKYGVEMQPKPDETPLVYFACNKKINGFDGDRDEFIGSYRSEENPLAVENSGCTNSTLAGGDPCFAFEIILDLVANQETELNIFLGTAMTKNEIIDSVKNCRSADFVNKSFEVLKEDYKRFLNKFECSVPDEDANRMINIWNPYQVQRNFLFSRNISYYATGTFRGVGFRDTAQDIIAMIPLDIEASKDKIKLLLTQQYKEGHVNHYFFPNEGWEPVKRKHSDNHLWIIMAVYAVVMEEGKTDFLSETVEYFDGGKASIWEHLKKAIEFTRANMGRNGFPLMLHSDWNDMLYKVCREGKGESIFVSMQFGLCLQNMIELSLLLHEENNEYKILLEEQKRLINSIAWDGEWFKRAVMDNGEFLGSKDCPQAKIWLNTQSWAVICGLADKDKCLIAMDSVKRLLDTPLGIKKIDPAMEDYPSKEDPLTYYNKGTGENGSIFCHANTWAIIAECILGRGDEAFEYYKKLIPDIACKKSGLSRYKAEPYVYSSNIFGPESERFGLANVSWLTGTAAWMYIAVTQYILGIRACWDGLHINPCVPSEWTHFTVKREFRGCLYSISFNNSGNNNGSVKKITVDGKQMNGNVITPNVGQEICLVEIEF